MKKLLFIILLFASSLVFGQVRSNVFIVPDSVTAFGVTIPANNLIFDSGSNRIWTLTAKAGASDDLENSSKALLNSGGADGNGIYDGSGTLSGNTTITGGGNSLTLTDLSTFQVNETSSTLELRSATGLNLVNGTAGGGANMTFTQAGTGNIRINSNGGSTSFIPNKGMNIGSALLPEVTAEVQITSTTKGFLKSRLTTGQRDAIITPATGLELYNTTTNYPNYYDGTIWKEITTTSDYNEGRVKLNGHEGNKPSYSLSAGVEQIVYYGSGIGTDTLNLSSAPTNEWPLNIASPVDSNMWNASDSAFYENFIPGQAHFWRVILDYSGKNNNDVVGLEVLLRNDLSGFETKNTVVLPEGRTADTDQQALLITIADGVSLPPPFGTGVGYKLILKSNKSISVTINSVTRISQQHNKRP